MNQSNRSQGSAAHAVNTHGSPACPFNDRKAEDIAGPTTLCERVQCWPALSCPSLR